MFEPTSVRLLVFWPRHATMNYSTTSSWYLKLKGTSCTRCLVSGILLGLILRSGFLVLKILSVWSSFRRRRSIYMLAFLLKSCVVLVLLVTLVCKSQQTRASQRLSILKSRVLIFFYKNICNSPLNNIFLNFRSCFFVFTFRAVFLWFVLVILVLSLVTFLVLVFTVTFILCITLSVRILCLQRSSISFVYT